ncbi:MAG: DinB family protein [Mucilaginibacter sp.]
MKRLTLLFTLMVTVFSSASVYAQVSSEQMIADWQRSKDYTKEYLEAMPEAGYSFKVTPEVRTFAGLMLHLADGNCFLAGPASGKPNPFGASAEKTIPQTKEATIKAVMDSYDYVINALKALTPAQLQEIVKVAGKDITKAVAINKAFEHQAHTRGQAVAYLRLKGVTPPPEKLF